MGELLNHADVLVALNALETMEDFARVGVVYEVIVVKTVISGIKVDLSALVDEEPYQPPGPNWTDVERLKTIVHFADTIIAEVQDTPPTAQQCFDWTERMRFVLTMSAPFLELNRDQILDGFDKIQD